MLRFTRFRQVDRRFADRLTTSVFSEHRPLPYRSVAPYQSAIGERVAPPAGQQGHGFKFRAQQKWINVSPETFGQSTEDPG